VQSEARSKLAKMWAQRISLAVLLFAGTALSAADTTFWIEPCSVMGTPCRPGDMDLARWALAAWQDASGNKLHFVESKDRASALLRFRWADKNSGLYGEAVPIIVNGKRGSELHILIPEPIPENDARRDELLRDTIVYLTCLHEAGHALGLNHTRAFADIMYSFQFGGDIDEYFGRYRRKLKTREDIKQNAGMSDADKVALSQSTQMPIN
jgi:hypothetical protein